MEDVSGIIGEVASTTNVNISLAPPEDNSIGAPSGPSGDLLFEYQTEGRIGGIRVDQADRGVPVSSEDELLAAFELDRVPRLLSAYVKPGEAGATDAYEELLRKVYEGEAVVIDESREWDQAGARFALWVRYDEVRYRLRKRYAYLREQTKE